MKVSDIEIKRVLALFDDEDIPYINIQYLYNHFDCEEDVEKDKNDTKQKVKVIGGKND